MYKAYKIFRDIVLPAILAAFVLPIIGEFSIEVAREHGFFEHPSERLGAAMSFLFAAREHVWFWPALTFATGLLIGMWLDSLALRHLRRREMPVQELTASTTAVIHPDLRILFEAREPYESSEISAQGRILSTVRVGLKAVGITLSNCRVFIEKIAPIPPLPGGGPPMLLAKSDFILRPDEPETSIDIASHWDHVTQWRFSTTGGHWAESLNYIDDDIPRVFEIKMVATELQKTALFKLWTDESKQLHLKRM